jgi:hypothetical protein
MGRRSRAVSSGCLEAWLGLGLAQGAMVVLPSNLFGGPVALASPATMAEPCLVAGRGVPGQQGKWGGGRDAPAWVCARDCRVAGLRLGQGRQREQATAPASTSGPWPWDGGGRRSRGGPTCKKRAMREGWVFKGERSPGGFLQIALVRFFQMAETCLTQYKL